MKRNIYKIGIALLTLTIGLAASSRCLKQYFRSSAVQPTATKFESTNSETKLNLSNSDKLSLLCELKADLDTTKINELLASGVNVNSTTDSCSHSEPSPRGVTLLMIAAWKGNLETVKILLENGAEINAMSSWDDTPLAAAIDGNNPEIIKLLVENGANLNTRGESGETLLMDAAYQGNPEIIKFLLDQGADVNAVDKNKVTALMYAAAEKQADVMKLLIERGANPNAKDKDGHIIKDYLENGFPMAYRIF